MKNTLLFLGLALAATACSRGEANQSVPPTATALNAPATVTGAPAAAAPAADRTAAVATPSPAASAASTPATADRKPSYREITIPAGTVLPLTLRTAVSSGTSNVEDQVRATLGNPLRIQGVAALPEGTALIGHVTDAARSAKVKGRARIAFRFTRMDLPGDAEQLTVRTGTVARVAEGTKKQDATKIGGGAVGGAIIGGILGGGDGAAKGAAIGGAAGTGVVLATRGKEVGFASGAPVSVTLTAPLTVRVRAD